MYGGINTKDKNHRESKVSSTLGFKNEIKKEKQGVLTWIVENWSDEQDEGKETE